MSKQRHGGGFAALVNGEAITTYELEQKVEQRLRSLGSRYSEEMLQGRVREQQREVVLEELVTERLLLQRCAREKIEVRPEEVDAWIQMRLEDLRRRDDSIRTVGDLFDRWEVDFGENEEQAREPEGREHRGSMRLAVPLLDEHEAHHQAHEAAAVEHGVQQGEVVCEFHAGQVTSPGVTPDPS